MEVKLKFMLVVGGFIWLFGVLNYLLLDLYSGKESEELQVASLELKRQLNFPNITYAIMPYSQTYLLNLQSLPLERYPLLPNSQEVACVPSVLGYTQAQADDLFNPNRKFRNCIPINLVRVKNNSLTLNCDRGAYLLGTNPQEELLGNVDFPLHWQSYNSSVDLGTTEFAFAKCTGQRASKQGFLFNRFNSTASKRALGVSKSISSEFNPLSVFLIVFDSVSRQHFYRNFPETIRYLNQEIANQSNFLVYDFLVNNARGDNTIPNMVPLLYGYKLESHLMRLKGFNYEDPEDWWKFHKLQEEALWKHYEQMGFVTMFGFDTIWDFLSKCTGRKIRTDHVATNFWHAAKKVFGYEDSKKQQRCLGEHHSHYFMLNYSKQFLQNYEGHNRFGYVHLSPGHEKTGTVIRTADSDVKEFFREILNYYRSNQEDFVIMFASDHGKQPPEQDTSVEGYYENLLPVHLVISNKEYISRLGPQTHEILQHNTKRLVSRLDWHLTFKHLAVSPYGVLSKNSELYSAWKGHTDSQKAVSVFLEKIPHNRSCEDVDIPSFLCTCELLEPVPIDQAVKEKPIQDLIALGIEHINNSVEPSNGICTAVSFSEVLEAKAKKASSTNYRIRVSVNEDSKAVFELHGIADYDKRFLGSVKLEKVIRVDTYAGICEEMAKVVGVSGAMCICKKPSETGKSVQSVTQQLLDKIRVVESYQAKDCGKVCSGQLLNCFDWGFELIGESSKNCSSITLACACSK